MSEIFTPTPNSDSEVTPTLINGHKIDICHVPPGNPENAHVIEVDIHAWENGHTPHNAHNMDFIVDESNTCPPEAEATPTRTPGAPETKTATPFDQRTPTPESPHQLPSTGGEGSGLDLTPVGIAVGVAAAGLMGMRWWTDRVRRVQSGEMKSK